MNDQDHISVVQETGTLSEDALKKGGALFERFWLRPKKYANQKAELRLRINQRWNGWKVKDELIESLDLEVGDTISTEVTPFYTSGLIEDNNDTDLFASDRSADWIIQNHVGVGTIIDCEVRFVYAQAPVGAGNKWVNKVSLVLERGIAVVGHDHAQLSKAENNPSSLSELLQALMP